MKKLAFLGLAVLAAICVCAFAWVAHSHYLAAVDRYVRDLKDFAYKIDLFYLDRSSATSIKRGIENEGTVTVPLELLEAFHDTINTLGEPDGRSDLQLVQLESSFGFRGIRCSAHFESLWMFQSGQVNVGFHAIRNSNELEFAGLSFETVPDQLRRADCRNQEKTQPSSLSDLDREKILTAAYRSIIIGIRKALTTNWPGTDAEYTFYLRALEADPPACVLQTLNDLQPIRPFSQAESPDGWLRYVEPGELSEIYVSVLSVQEGPSGTASACVETRWAPGNGNWIQLSLIPKDAGWQVQYQLSYKQLSVTARADANNSTS